MGPSPAGQPSNFNASNNGNLMYNMGGNIIFSVCFLYLTWGSLNISQHWTSLLTYSVQFAELYHSLSLSASYQDNIFWTLDMSETSVDYSLSLILIDAWIALDHPKLISDVRVAEWSCCLHKAMCHYFQESLLNKASRTLTAHLRWPRYTLIVRDWHSQGGS